MDTEFDEIELKAATLLTTVGTKLNGANPLKANDSEAFRQSVEMLSLLRGGTPIQQIYRPLPLNVLPDSLRNVIQAAETKIACPPELAFAGVMSALSVSISSYLDIESFMGTGSIPMTLMLMASAISGDRKSTSDSYLHKGIYTGVNKYQQEFDTSVSWHASDLTVEGAMKSFTTTPILALNNGDAASFFNSNGMSKDRVNQTIAFLADAWSGSAMSHARSGESKQVTEPRLSASLLTQEQYLAEFLCNETFRNQGLAARFLYLTTISKQGKRLLNIDSVLKNKKETDHYASQFWDFTQQQMRTGLERFQSGQAREVFPLSKDTIYVLGEFYNDIEKESGRGKAYRGNPWAQRSTEHANRLAGLIAAFNGETEVGQDSAIAGCTLSQHFLDRYLELSRASAQDEKQGAAQELLTEIIERGWESTRQIAMSKKHGRTTDVRKLLNILEEEGSIEWTSGRAGKETRFTTGTTINNST